MILRKITKYFYLLLEKFVNISEKTKEPRAARKINKAKQRHSHTQTQSHFTRAHTAYSTQTDKKTGFSKFNIKFAVAKCCNHFISTIIFAAAQKNKSESTEEETRKAFRCRVRMCAIINRKQQGWVVNASHTQQHMSYSNFCAFFILRADIFLSFSSSFSIRLVFSPLAGSHPASLRRLFSPFPSSAYSSAGFIVLYFTHLHKPSRNITYSTAKRHKCTNVHENCINSIRC